MGGTAPWLREGLQRMRAVDRSLVYSVFFEDALLSSPNDLWGKGTLGRRDGVPMPVGVSLCRHASCPYTTLKTDWKWTRRLFVKRISLHLSSLKCPFRKSAGTTGCRRCGAERPLWTDFARSSIGMDPQNEGEVSTLALNTWPSS